MSRGVPQAHAGGQGLVQQHRHLLRGGEGAGARLHHHHDLAPRRLLVKKGGQFRHRSPMQGLVQLGQLPRHHDGARPGAQGGQIVQCRGQALGGLEKDHRPRLRRHSPQTPLPLPPLARQEPLEDESLPRKAAPGQGGGDRRGPRQRLHRHAQISRRPRQQGTGIADAGRAGIRYQRDPPSCRQIRQHPRQKLRGGVVIEAAHRGGHPVMVAQNSRSACVLRQNALHLAQDAHPAQGHIFQVADRRGNDV